MLTRRLFTDQRGATIADVIILPIYMFLLFATIFFMFFLRARVIMYEAAYLGLSVAHAAVEHDDADAAALAEEAVERFLDRINAVTVRRFEVTRSRPALGDSTYETSAVVEGGWEPGPLINLFTTITAEVCLQSDDRVRFVGVTTCP